MSSDVTVDPESNKCGCAGELARQAVLLCDELFVACEEGGEWLWGVESGDWWHDWGAHREYRELEVLVKRSRSREFVDSWQ